jgi:M6 family metalloprotease-like protein
MIGGFRDARAASGATATAVAAVAVLALAGSASAADCTLSGSGEEGATDTSFYQVPDQTIEASMIFVDFPGDEAVPSEDPPDETIGPDLVNWAKDYYDEVSYGDTQLDVKMDDEWVRMDDPASSYGATTFAAQHAYMAEAIAKANPGFDFSGRRVVYVVAAPTAPNDDVLPNSPAFIAYADEAIAADGVSIRWGATIGDDAHDSSGDYGSHVLAHETGHTFGLPDLYSYSAGSDFAAAHRFAGAWDLMGWIGPGLHLIGWHKQKLGWLEPSEWICVDAEATADLAPLAAPGGTKMLVSKTGPATAYVAEVRTPVGVDAGMCDNGGVLVYAVNANGAGGAANGTPPVQVKLAHPEAPGSPAPPCAALNNAPFGIGAGETSSFSEGPVTVDVLGTAPGGGFRVRMRGPDQPDDTQLGKLKRKVKLRGRKRAVAALSCPASGGDCEGKLTLKLSGGEGTLAKDTYSVPDGEQENLKLKIRSKAKKPLGKALRGKGGDPKGKAILESPDGKEKQSVKLVG